MGLWKPKAGPRWVKSVKSGKSRTEKHFSWIQHEKVMGDSGENSLIGMGLKA